MRPSADHCPVAENAPHFPSDHFRPGGNTLDALCIHSGSSKTATPGPAPSPATPTAWAHPAQGCASRATLGTAPPTGPTLPRVASGRRRRAETPLGFTPLVTNLQFGHAPTHETLFRRRSLSPTHPLSSRYGRASTKRSFHDSCAPKLDLVTSGKSSSRRRILWPPFSILLSNIPCPGPPLQLCDWQLFPVV